MKSDEEIERERAELEPLIGPVRADWYATACMIEQPPDISSSQELLWACRYREVTRTLGDVVKAILAAKEDGHVFGNRPCKTCAAISSVILEPYGCDLYKRRDSI